MGRRSRSKRQREGSSDGGGPRPDARSRMRWAVAALAVAVLVAGLVGGGLLFRSLSSGGDQPDGAKVAAIVDQLSLTQPSQGFVERATELLHDAGYLVDYYPGERVTVDLYRELPTRGYDLILLRVHSSRIAEKDGTITDDASLFTGEPYSQTKHIDERRLKRVGISLYYEGAPPLFGILPEFIAHSMEGRFQDTLIVAMGCDGLRSERPAQEFLDKGAKAFVSWNRSVSAGHTDAAPQRLLEKLLIEGLTVEDAVAQTAAEVGPDPAYGAELRIVSREG